MLQRTKVWNYRKHSKNDISDQGCCIYRIFVPRFRLQQNLRLFKKGIEGGNTSLLYSNT